MCCTVTKKSAIWSSKMEQDRSSVVSPRLPARTPTPVAAVNLLKFIVNHNDYVLCLCTTACASSLYLIWRRNEESLCIILFGSIAIIHELYIISYHKSFSFYACIYHHWMLRFPRPPRRPARLASEDSEALSRRITDGLKLALLTALDGGCILKKTTMCMQRM